MAPICASCLRAMRQQARKELQLHPSRHLSHRIPISNETLRRTFTSSHQPSAEQQNIKQAPRQPPPPPPTDPLKNLASSIRHSPTLKQTTEPYIAYGTTSALLAECSKQISYTIPSALANPATPAPQNARGEDLGEGSGWWYTPKSQGGLGLECTFASWAQVMFLYMYALTARLRAFPAKDGRVWQQQLLDHFFYAAEDRMAVWHRISTRGVRNRYLKDLAQQWRGILLSYDEGVIRGDAVLAGAVWRNVFKGDEGADVQDVALVTAFLRAQLRMLDQLSDADVGERRVEFQDPGKLRAMVAQSAPMMKKAFSNEEVGAARARAE